MHNSIIIVDMSALQGLKKMWTIERREPRDKDRETIFATEKNLRRQFANMNSKRHLQEIKDQTSVVFHFDKKNYDRSLVAAPTKQLRIDRYYQLKDNEHPQRETIFATPAVLNKMNTYKSLDSKKHYSTIQASTNMNVAVVYARACSTTTTWTALWRRLRARRSSLAL